MEAEGNVSPRDPSKTTINPAVHARFLVVGSEKNNGKKVPLRRPHPRKMILRSNLEVYS